MVIMGGNDESFLRSFFFARNILSKFKIELMRLQNNPR